jgi:diguanylate cyclase (GGDEF)-like protein/PAS domain S-box-containing protein
MKFRSHIVNTPTDISQISYQALPSKIFQFAADGVMLTNSQKQIIDINPMFEKITGYSRRDVIGEKPGILSSGVHSAEFYDTMSNALEQNGNWSGDIWNRNKNGNIYLENLSITAIRNSQGKPEYYLAMLRDITEQRLYKDKLRKESLYDPLTNLPNRKLLAEGLEKAMAQADLNAKKMAVYFVDLDAFKQINDDLGHDAGDKVLSTMANAIELCLRDNDMIARLGGDEFAGIITGLDNNSDCFPILHRILRALAEPIKVQGTLINLSGSIGVTFYPQANTLDGEQLLRQADVAMYLAKQSGKNTFKIFDEINALKQQKNNCILDEIRVGIRQNEFVLHYQPKVNMTTNQFIGVEALIRWQHPERGLLQPGEFLSAIDEHCLSIELGYWVIENALKQIATWQDLGFEIPVSVNITSMHIHQDDFIANLRQLLSVYGQVDAKLLELEIVESSVLYDIDKVVAVIQKCDALGITVSLDDFGTGYSSLPYLRKLPVSKLKIDRSFTSNILNSTADLSIIEAVMALGAAFSCDIIAEGVETEEQGLLLLKLGCQNAQGFFISKPLTAPQFIHWLSEKKDITSWESQKQLKDEALLLTYAIVEHRGWLEKVKLFLRDQNASHPQSNHKKCLFTAWYNRSSRITQNKQLDTQVYCMHQQMHQLASEVITIREQLTSQALTKEIQNLQALSNDFLSLLDTQAEPEHLINIGP